MSSAVQDIPRQEHNGIRHTGFPEPLSLERNTTLPYPTADLSETACIESLEAPIARQSSNRIFSSSSSRRLVAKGYLHPNHKTQNTHYVDCTIGDKPRSSHSKGSISESDYGEEDFKSGSEDRTSGETDRHKHLRHKTKGIRRIFSR